MKQISLILISIYQIILSPFLRNSLGLQVVCRFNPSCSQYMKDMIIKYGFQKGLLKGLNQLKNCHPKGEVYGAI